MSMPFRRGARTRACRVGTLADAWRAIRERVSVESRMGARTDAERPPVSHPRSSNRTCLSQSSGFPPGFIVDSQTRAHRPLQANHAQGAEHPFLGELMGALRGHLLAPSQKVPYLVVDMLVNRPISLRRAPTAEIRAPAVQCLVQPFAHFRPWPHVAGH